MWCLCETLYSPKVEPAQYDDCFERVTYVCIQYVVQCFFSFPFFFSLQAGLHTSSNIHPIAPCAILFLSCSYPVPQAHSILHCRSHSSGAIFLLYIPHSQGAAIAITLDGGFIDWMSCLSQGIENEVGRLVPEKYYPWIGRSLNWPWRSSFQSFSSM